MAGRGVEQGGATNRGGGRDWPRDGQGALPASARASSRPTSTSPGSKASTSTAQASGVRSTEAVEALAS